MNNFAVIYGLALVIGGSSIKIYSSTIENNYAIQLPVMFLTEAVSTSIFDNSTISNNPAMNQSQVYTELFTVCTKLCFIPQNYKSFIQSNLNLLNYQQEDSIFEILVSTVLFQNGTIISNQNAIIISFSSNISFVDSFITNITLSKTGIQLISSLLTFDNTTISNLNSNGSLSFMQSMIDWTIQINSSSYISSIASFLNSISTNIKINALNVRNVTCTTNLIQISQSSDIEVQGTTFGSISITSPLIYIYSSNKISVRNLTASGVLATIFAIKSSNITSIDGCSITQCSLALLSDNSIISSITNSRFDSNGNTSQTQGGAIRMVNSQISIQNTTFVNNTAINGGAISFECSDMLNWALTVSNINFTTNYAVSKGGAIYYNFARPNLNQITYANNTAPYGPNIASYAVKVRFAGQATNQMKVTNMISGVAYGQEMILELADYDDQVLVLNSIDHVDFSPLNSSVKIKGSNSALFKNGIATFNNLNIIAIPGSINVQFQANWLAINDSKIESAYGHLISKNIIYADFRFWEPGEIQMQDYSWSVWQTGTYSLNWNSTQWTLWPSNSEWLGGVQISLNSGYWRISTNETYIIEWLYSGAWNGGYFPNNEYPVAWAAGYTGILWNECQTLENTKYQKISNYQWQEWPNPVYNSIKVIGVILLVFIFLMVIIIINIRKSRESEMSVLMRILTNYVQLITASISGNIKFPDTITSIFIPAEQVGGSSDTFLSFDWFFSYTEILKIFDSTSIFKLFLTGILPIFLTIFAFATLMAIYLFNKRLFPSIKRNAIISFISILLLLHPKLASSSLSIFQWVQIDSHQERVRINTSIEWYSGEHLKWCFLIGFPDSRNMGNNYSACWSVPSLQKYPQRRAKRC